MISYGYLMIGCMVDVIMRVVSMLVVCICGSKSTYHIIGGKMRLVE